MNKHIYSLIIALVIFAIIIGSIGLYFVQAQDTPPQLYPALNNLSQLVGKTLTVADLQAWTVQAVTFANSSLGCPRPGNAYLMALTSGYKILLTYHGVTFDYRSNGRNVFLCRIEFQS